MPNEIYFHLIWLFVIVISLLMLFLCYLYFSKQRALNNEHTSFAFSHLVMEGMETERQRISRELHDIILPQVMGLPVGAQIRAICMELMPPDFSKLSLKDLMADICNKFIKQTGIESAFFIEKEISFTHLSAENQLHLYRMMQESFTNIKKHSKANRALLVVRRDNENIVICVSDDGVGLGGSEEGLGMKSLRQRASIIGARIDFISESANGLMVKIELPMLLPASQDSRI